MLIEVLAWIDGRVQMRHIDVLQLYRRIGGLLRLG
jgi:hypothetical protein